jgi:ketosteroid isomerase-like protein
MIGANFSQEDAMMTSARDAVEKDYKAFAEAFHKGDLDTISQMYTEDAEFRVYHFSPPYKLPRQENPEVAYGQRKSDTRGFRDAS